jgi:hypothetical protein
LWSFKEDIYRETVIKFFTFYQSFDMFAYNFAEINQSSYNLGLFNQLWRECNSHKEKKDLYQKEFEELKTIIPSMNEKKKKKPVGKKIEDLHITNDVTYKRKFEMIKNDKPIVTD